jgi:hypothetical protein
MGMFAFRRLRELEVSASAGASFSNAEPTPKLESTPEKPATKKTSDGKAQGGAC